MHERESVVSPRTEADNEAYRSKQIFDTWADVWASQRSRVKFVLSTQAVSKKQA